MHEYKSPKYPRIKEEVFFLFLVGNTDRKSLLQIFCVFIIKYYFDGLLS